MDHVKKYLKKNRIALLMQIGIPPQEWNGTKKYINLLGICDAMRYLHEQGILHRDLKPLNVLTDSNYYPRVCDFGLSKCFSKSLSQGVQVSMTGQIGSPIYMAPELFEDEHGHFGTGIDMYAFAILMYEVVTEVTPFMENGKSIGLMTLSRKLSNGERPKITSNVTEKMKQLLERCWSGNPNDRPSFKEVFELLSSDLTYINDPIDKQEVDKYVNMLKEARKIEKKKRKESSSKHKKERSKSKDKDKKKSEEENSSNNVKLSSLIIDTTDIEKKRKIGRGGYGDVYEVVLPEEICGHTKECAQKVAKPYSSIIKAIEIQASLKHTAILPLIGFAPPSEEEPNYSVFTPIMQNGALSNLIEKVNKGQAPKNWETIRAINMFGIAAGMAYMHQHGIINGDLKPGNILLDENFHPKICDFDLAEYLKLGETLPANSKGTLPYMPPEALEDESISHKQDVYAYSMVLYELFTGKRPYERENMYSILSRVTKGGRPRIDEDLPEFYQDLICQCWAQDPDERPSFAQIIKLFIDNKKELSNFDLVDENEIDDYIGQAVQGIDLSEA